MIPNAVMDMVEPILVIDDVEFPANFEQSHFAFELAADLHDQKDVLKRHGITQKHFKALMKSNEFLSQFEEYKREWQSPKNVKERIQMKAALAVEDGMLELYHLFKDRDKAPAARLDAFKQFVQLSGSTPGKEESAGGSGFAITINVGKHAEGEVRPGSVTIEGESATIDAD